MKRILVVDDDPDIVDLVKNRLEGDNFEVFTASNGDQGIKLAQKHEPDLIVMDIMMPNMSGGDAVRVLQSDDKTMNIPVIFLTAVTADMPDGVEKDMINVNGEYFKSVAKPFEATKLLTEIREIIGHD